MRKPLDRKAVSCMLLLCLIWALQPIVLKATAADFPPLLQLGLRSGGAAVLVVLLMLWRGERIAPRDGTLPAGVLVGLLFGLEFLLVGEGLRHTSAAHMVVFLYTAPIFAALGLHLRLPAERLAPLQWLGIVLAFGGVAIAFLGRDPGHAGFSRDMLLGDFMGLMAGLVWGATTVAVRCSRLSSAPATQTLLYQLLGAFVLLTAAAWASGQAHINPTPQVWASLLFQVLVVSFASFLLWFSLMRTYLASRLGAFSFLTPMLGVVLGAVLLGEAIERHFLLATVPVLLGVVLVSAHGSVVMASQRGWQRLARHRRANAVAGPPPSV
ncbi:DMT family transporter [Comamonadaceae bacterium G21597-S1]|nr:DMT family transporter [Comamonadaceae bacterium G21597-S1]